jgi:hypothetical protein
MIIRTGDKFTHRKSGHVVTVVRIGKLQTDWEDHGLHDNNPMVVYEHDGNCWVRSADEFADGRFERV